MARKTKAIFSPEDRVVLLGAYEDGMDGVGKEKCEKIDRISVQLGKSSEDVRVSDKKAWTEVYNTTLAHANKDC